MPDPAVYRVDELVDILQCGRRQLYELIREGQIPGVIRLGSRSIRISRHAIDQWLNGAAQGGTEDDELTGASPPTSDLEEAPNGKQRTSD